MKKLLSISFFTLFLSLFFVSHASVKPLKPKVRTIVTSYHKSCFIGCGSVDITRSSVSITHGDGTIESVIYKTVSCTGIGFHSCPKHGSSIYVGEPTNWINSAAIGMFDHAVAEIDGGNNSGTHQQVYNNVDTGHTLTFEVVWSYVEVTPGEWQQDIEVAIVQ